MLKKVLIYTFALFAVQFLVAKTYVVEIEESIEISDWNKMYDKGVAALHTKNSNQPVLNLVDVPEDGKYKIYLRAFDAPKDHGKRSVQVAINGVNLKRSPDCGANGKEAWIWEEIGCLDLKKGSNTITIKRIGTYPRIDALLLTTDEKINPSKYDDRQIRKSIILERPSYKDEQAEKIFTQEKLEDIKNANVVYIENDFVKLSFTQKQNAKGGKFYERSLTLKDSGKLLELPSFKDEILYVGFESEDPQYYDRYFSAWLRSRTAMNVNFEDKTYNLNTIDNNLYTFEKSILARPVDVKKISADKILLTYSNSLGAELTLCKDSGIVKMQVTYKCPEDGFYSIGFLGFNAVDEKNVKSVLLPPLFQRGTLMESPKQIGNRMTSHPMVFLHSQIENGVDITNALVADPEKFDSTQWGMPKNSVYAFTLANPKNIPQTGIAEPILGGVNSAHKKGDEIKSSWYIFSVAGDWQKALHLANNNIYKGGQLFREAYETSFSDAICNIAAYLKNGKHSGWVPNLKGRTNIEGANLVTNATANTELSVALLTQDEDYYKNISLPVIEYTLSRGAFHFTDLDAKNHYGAKPILPVTPRSWGADYYMSLNRLLGNSNTWLEEYVKMLPPLNSDPKNWMTYLGMYLANPKPEYLEKSKTLCDTWLEEAFFPKSREELYYRLFVNIYFYPNWSYLNDLYEATKDKKYLDFAKRGAYHNVASIWGYPTPPEGEITINKGNKIVGLGYVWWFGDKRYRLGMDEYQACKNYFESPNKPEKRRVDAEFILPEKKVDALKVSKIGLGIEQPSTYMATNYDRGHNLNINMPSWSAEMLGVYKNTGDEFLLNFSRHCIIGRFSNFLGYYILDYTDVMHDEMYPYKGPDMTSFYYHHAPCHFAQSFDYLMTQYEIASNGKIKFPFLRQQGYAWFSDRIFGLAGKIGGDENCKIVLDKSAVTSGSSKVSVLTARAEDGVWVMLLNDSKKDLKVEPKFNSTSKLFADILPDMDCDVYDANFVKKGKTGFFDSKAISIPPMSLISIKIPAKKIVISDIQKPLSKESRIMKKDVDKTMGDFHLIRIRSPFGKDSLYAFLTKGSNSNAEFVLEIKTPSKQKIVCNKFPYEISIYPLTQESEITGSGYIKKSDGNIVELGEFSLKN